MTCPARDEAGSLSVEIPMQTARARVAESIVLKECPYRETPAAGDARGDYACSLLHQLSRVADRTLWRVGYDACRACGRHERPTATRINPVVASFLYRIACLVIEAGGLPDCTFEEAIRLKTWAFDNLVKASGTGRPTSVRICYAAPKDFALRRRTYACDVVVCCDDSSPETEAAIRSCLNQTSATTQVHLVDNGGTAGKLIERYAGYGTVTAHRNHVPLTPLATVQRLLEQMSGEFIAIQDPRTVSKPHRISYSVGLLEEHGGDLLGAGLATAAVTVRPATPEDRYRRYLPPETLVLRRASLVDMGGVAKRRDDDAEFVYRAHREQRVLLAAPEVTVEVQNHYRPPSPIGPPPAYNPHNGSLRHHALGFPEQRVACDVVLPFWKHVDFARQALESLLAQQNADVVVHLIDDGSPEDSEALLQDYSRHPQVRTYRNLCNLSQFTSFNNVVPYLETELVAVQDGDDISLPYRLSLAGNALRLSRAGVFGSAVLIPQDGEPLELEGWDCLPPDVAVQRRVDIGISAWPTPAVYWFVFNPTMVVRTDVFRSLGGFADFGGTIRNRCGHDIEFCLRAYHGGVRFAISHQPTVLYRQHPGQTTRNPATGFGTDAERWTSEETRRRGALYRRTRFDPVAFGALGKFTHLTRRYP